MRINIQDIIFVVDKTWFRLFNFHLLKQNISADLTNRLSITHQNLSVELERGLKNIIPSLPPAPQKKIYIYIKS